MRFTDTMIRNLKSDKKMYLREADGFTIRVMPSGAKTWLFVYTFDGRRKEMNLGSYPDVSLADARGKHADAKKLLKNGKDPAAIEAEAKEERRKSPMVADLCSEYIEKHAKRFKKSWRQDEELLKRDVLPSWGKRKAEDVRKRDVTLLLESIVERGSPSMSNRVFSVIRKMFNFAVERDILTFSPCLGVKALAPIRSCERTLSETEIRTLWESLDNAAMSDEVRRALKLILVTAQRPGEIAGIHSDEIDGRWWTIPAERAKNAQPHRVYLTDLAIELIGNHEATVENTDEEQRRGYFFASPKGEGKHINPHAMAVAVRSNTICEKKGKKLVKSNVNRLGVEQFTPHDLRRTAATFIAGMGFMDEIIDAVLNHVKKGVIKIYNRHDYDREKQQALEAWERKLISITSGAKSKVIALRRKAENTFPA